MLSELFVRLGTEAAHGTVASTFVAVPVEEFTTVLKEEPDYPEEARGTQDEAFLALRARQIQESSIGGRIYHDAHESILRSLFGAPTITANADGTRTLVFKAVNDPASLSAQWFDKVQARQSLYTVVNEYEASFGGEEKLAWTAKLLGQPETDIATPAASFSSAVPFVNWQAAVTIGGGASAELVTYKLAYKRNITPFYTARGAASARVPLRMVYGKRGGSLELLLDFLTQAEYTQAKNLAQRGVVVTFTDTNVVIGSAARNPSIAFDVPKAVWSTKEVDLGGDQPLLKLTSDKLLAGTDSSLIVTLVTV